jgi:hypothetical protein
MNILEENEEPQELTLEELCTTLDAICRNSGLPPTLGITALEIVKSEIISEITCTITNE